MQGCNQAVIDAIIERLAQINPQLANQMGQRVQLQLQGVGAYDPHAAAVAADDLFKAVQRAGYGRVIDEVLQQIPCPTARVTRVRTGTAVPTGVHHPAGYPGDGLFRGY